MIFYPDERMAIFIDGANLYATARTLEIEIDYGRLRDFFARKSRLIRAFYYTAIQEDLDYSPLRPLVDWLEYNSFTLITKPTKEFVDDQGRRRKKGNMDIEIAVDMLNLSDNLDHVVLFSGDGDFRRLLEAVQRRGVRATVVSTTSTQPSLIADELRRQADQFIDLVDLEEFIGRSGARRPERRSDRRAVTSDERSTYRDDDDDDTDDDDTDDGDYDDDDRYYD